MATFLHCSHKIFVAAEYPTSFIPIESLKNSSYLVLKHGDKYFRATEYTAKNAEEVRSLFPVVEGVKIIM